MEYRVELETFHGPLDLLLFLVKRNEVDICDIPIAKIAEQFQHYLELLQLIDVESAGEFLVMAATLMEIKSRMLLPRGEEAEVEEEDPRSHLVKQLIEYKKFKDAANLLDRQAQQQMLRVPRQPVDVPRPQRPDEQPIHQVELWDLVSAFGRLLQETAALQPQQIVLDDTPIHVTMRRIVDRLRKEGPCSFADVFGYPRTRGRLISIFLAILELIKARLVLAEQPDLFSDISIRLNPETEANEQPLESSFD